MRSVWVLELIDVDYTSEIVGVYKTQDDALAVKRSQHDGQWMDVREFQVGDTSYADTREAKHQEWVSRIKNNEHRRSAVFPNLHLDFDQSKGGRPHIIIDTAGDV